MRTLSSFENFSIELMNAFFFLLLQTVLDFSLRCNTCVKGASTFCLYHFPVCFCSSPEAIVCGIDSWRCSICCVMVALFSSAFSAAYRQVCKVLIAEFCFCSKALVASPNPKMPCSCVHSETALSAFPHNFVSIWLLGICYRVNTGKQHHARLQKFFG